MKKTGEFLGFSFAFFSLIFIYRGTLFDLPRADHSTLISIIKDLNFFKFDDFFKIISVEFFGDNRFQPLAWIFHYLQLKIFWSEFYLYHLLNLLLHTLNAYFLFKIMEITSKNIIFSLCTSLVFMFAYTHVDMLGWPFHSYVLLQVTLILTSLYIILKSHYCLNVKKWPAYVLSLIQIYLYEPGIFFPVILLFVDGSMYIKGILEDEDGNYKEYLTFARIKHIFKIKTSLKYIGGLSVLYAFYFITMQLFFWYDPTSHNSNVHSRLELLNFHNLLKAALGAFTVYIEAFIQNTTLSPRIFIDELLFYVPSHFSLAKLKLQGVYWPDGYIATLVISAITLCAALFTGNLMSPLNYFINKNEILSNHKSKFIYAMKLFFLLVFAGNIAYFNEVYYEIFTSLSIPDKELTNFGIKDYLFAPLLLLLFLFSKKPKVNDLPWIILVGGCGFVYSFIIMMGRPISYAITQSRYLYVPTLFMIVLLSFLLKQNFKIINKKIKYIMLALSAFAIIILITKNIQKIKLVENEIVSTRSSTNDLYYAAKEFTNKLKGTDKKLFVYPTFYPDHENLAWGSDITPKIFLETNPNITNKYSDSDYILWNKDKISEKNTGTLSDEGKFWVSFGLWINDSKPSEKNWEVFGAKETKENRDKYRWFLNLVFEENSQHKNSFSKARLELSYIKKNEKVQLFTSKAFDLYPFQMNEISFSRKDGVYYVLLNNTVIEKKKNGSSEDLVNPDFKLGKIYRMHYRRPIYFAKTWMLNDYFPVDIGEISVGSVVNRPFQKDAFQTWPKKLTAFTHMKRSNFGSLKKIPRKYESSNNILKPFEDKNIISDSSVFEASSYNIEANRPKNIGNNNSRNYWHLSSSEINNYNPVWFKVKLQRPEVVNYIKLLPRFKNALQMSFEAALLEGSNDDSNWEKVVIIKQSQLPIESNWISWVFENKKPFMNYKVTILDLFLDHKFYSLSGMQFGNINVEMSRIKKELDLLSPKGTQVDNNDLTKIEIAVPYSDKLQPMKNDYSQEYAVFEKNNFIADKKKKLHLELKPTDENNVLHNIYSSMYRFKEPKKINYINISKLDHSLFFDDAAIIEGSSDGDSWEKVAIILDINQDRESKVNKWFFDNKESYLFYRLNFRLKKEWTKNESSLISSLGYSRDFSTKLDNFGNGVKYGTLPNNLNKNLPEADRDYDVFSISLQKNLIPYEAKASAGSLNDDRNSPQMTTDNKFKTFWHIDSSNEEKIEKLWIEFDLKRQKEINYIKIKPRLNNFKQVYFKRAILEGSNDGGNWTELEILKQDKMPKSNQWLAWKLTANYNFRYFKLKIIEESEYQHFNSFAEIQFSKFSRFDLTKASEPRLVNSRDRSVRSLSHESQQVRSNIISFNDLGFMLSDENSMEFRNTVVFNLQTKKSFKYIELASNKLDQSGLNFSKALLEGKNEGSDWEYVSRLILVKNKIDSQKSVAFEFENPYFYKKYKITFLEKIDSSFPVQLDSVYFSEKDFTSSYSF